MPLLLLALVSLNSAQAQNHFVESVKVKANLAGGMFIEDGFSATFGFACVHTGFTAQSPAAQIAPGSGDPGHSTVVTDVMHIPSCWMDCSSGQCGAVWTWNFPSLQDLGVWSFTCSALQANPNYCTGSCTPTCDPAVVGEAIPYTIDITVWNSPPTASISHSPTPAWNQTVMLDANSSDPDGGSVTRTWSITSKPPGATANLSSTSSEMPTLSFNNDSNIGSWSFNLHVDDNEGERRSFTHSFTVPNVPPNISISGAADIDALLDNISIAVTPTNDVDGGALDIVWDLQQSPPTAAVAPQSNFCGPNPGYCSAGNSAITIPTTDNDIGIWQFQATATDNEGDDDTAQKTVEVHNIPPEIDLTGTSSIDIGETIYIETTIINDEDGGELDFLWEIVQAPLASSIPLGTYHSGLGLAGSSIDIPTGYSEAGTWIFRLTATDNDNQPDSEVSEEFTVLVDGPVEAVITGDALVGNLTLPSPLLDGDDSEDSDSPCDPPDYCHDTLDGNPVTLQNGQNLQYTWYLADVPLEYFAEYPLGRVDEVFGVSATGPTLNLSAGDLEEGDWVFELEVVDEEGNSDTTSFLVTVINETGPPFAIVTPTQRFTVNLANVISQNIVVDGSGSLDLDNLISGDPMPGITDYTWAYVSGPPGCASAPVPPSGAGATSFTLYSSGNVVPLECQGYWKISLTVTDDDSTPKVAIAETFVIIGNCDTILCIDYPTTVFPALVDFADDTDILIYYRLDSAAYDDLLFSSGIFTRLAIYHESDLTTPVYTDFDLNVLATNKGGNLVFHWNGFTDLGMRPIEGAYTVAIELFDSSLILAPVNAVELDSILIAVAEPVIQPTSDRFVERAALSGGSDTFDLSYTVNGTSIPDQVRWRIKDASNTTIFERTDAPTGNISWNGEVSPGNTISPGVYTAEVELLRAGSVLGTSQTPHPFVIYEMSMNVATGAYPGGGATPPEQLVLVNGDDDNSNGTVDSAENGPLAGENDLQRIDLTFNPSGLPPQVAANVKLLAQSGAANVKIWDTANKSANIALEAVYDLTAGAPPAQVFVEGLNGGDSELRWVLDDANAGVEVAHKAVLVRVHNLDADVDTDMDGAVNLVDDLAEMNDLAKIVYVNNDDDGGAGNDAVSNATIENAADKTELTELTLRRNASIPPGGKMVLQVSDNTKLRIFDQSDAAVIGPPVADGGPNLSQHDIPNGDITAGDLTYRIECVHGGLVTISLILYNSAMTEIARDELKVALNVHRRPGNTFASVRNYLVAQQNIAGLEGIEATLAGAKPIVSWDPASPISTTTSYWISIQDNAVTHWLQTGVRALRSAAGVDTEELYFEVVPDYTGYSAGTNPTGYQIFTKAGAGWNMGDFKAEITDRTTGEVKAFHGGVAWRTALDNAFKTAVFENYAMGVEPKQTVARTPGSAAAKARISASRYKDGTGWHNHNYAATNIAITATNGRGVATDTTAVPPATGAAADNRHFDRISGNEFEFWDDRN